MQLRFLAGVLALAAVVFLQAGEETKPQMIWQGDVGGAAFLYIQGKRLRTETRDGGRIENQRYRINDALPATRQDVRLRVSEGRGYIHIVEQPSLDNDYTLTVAIEDRQAGSSFYSIALEWPPGDAYDSAPSRNRPRVKWSGRVEEEVVVSCAGNKCTSEAIHGVPVMREHTKFDRPLPARDVRVILDDVNGRGEVRLIEQPSESNGYSTRLRIRDPQPGAGDYSFTLTWTSPAVAGSEPLAVQRGMTWFGRVGGDVRVTVKGSAAFSEVVRGVSVTDETTSFDRPLPARSDLKPAVKRIQGRGKVAIVEYPSDSNGYQLVFEIQDPGNGSDAYAIEVAW